MTGAPQADHKSIAGLQAYPKLDTDKMFGGAAPNVTASPLDQFIRNTDSINVIYLSATPSPQPGPGLTMTPELGALVLLGYMSAVESYFRAIVRGLIVTDEYVASIAEPMNVSYAAAMHHTKELLPEALTEHISFAGEKNVTSMLRDIIGIKGSFPIIVDQIIKEFVKVCEIRHCCVHRFGKLGSKTAIALGMASHKDVLENPFSPTVQDLQNVADLLRTFVKTINNFIFHSVIERVNDQASDRFRYSWQWSWDAPDDLERFRKYYNLFSTKIDTPASAPLEELYESLKLFMQAKNQPRRKRAASQGTTYAGQTVAAQ